MLWTSWLLLCMVIAVVQFQTLEIDPPVNQDEVQIIDLGRTILEPSSGWSMTWYVQGGHPTQYYTYIGIVLQEWAARSTIPSNLGPRLVAMLAAILAASCALGWLVSRGTAPWVALLIALALLLDPIFSNIYRGGRIDGWAMASCMASCWLLCLARERAARGLPVNVMTFAAGAFVALSFFLWASAPILFPLVLLECFYLARALNRSRTTAAGSWRATAFFSLGGGLSFAVLILPVLVNYEIFSASVLAMFESQSLVAGVQNPVFGLFATYDPALLLAVIAAFAVRRDWGLVIALTLSLLLAHRTAIYLPRIIYLLPYGLAAIAFAWPAANGRSMGRYAEFGRYATLAFLLLFNTYQVLLKRPAVAMAQHPANDPQQLLAAMENVIGTGPYRVLLEEWQFYYAGRDLGWHMFLHSNPVDKQQYIEFLSSMDYVIMRAEQGWYGVHDKLEPAGFQFSSAISFATPASSRTRVLGLEVNVPQVYYPTIYIYKKAAVTEGQP